MYTNVHFLSVYGALDGKAACHLLEIDNFRILLECGWDDFFDVELIEPLRGIAPTVDAVLISYADIAHIGALPYAVKHFGLKAPIYGTIPTFKFGQITLYDAFQSKRRQQNFDLFTPSDIDYSMERFCQLKYAQRFFLSSPSQNDPIEIMAHGAGHMIGGSIWLICKHLERILYAVDFNIRTQKHLNPCYLTALSDLGKNDSENVTPKYLDQSHLTSLTKPTVMLTDAPVVNYVQQRSEARNRDMISVIRQTLRDNGDVLIPVDSAGRVLELLIWLEDYSAEKRYYIIFLTNTAYSTVEFAKTQLEWLHDTLSQRFCDERVNAFDLKHVVTIHSLRNIDSLPKPRVILASSSTLETGYALDLFVQMAAHPNNTIILTERGAPGTLAAHLYERTTRSASNPDASPIDIQRWKRVPLAGKEMDAYVAKKKLEEEERAARRKKLLEASRKDAVQVTSQTFNDLQEEEAHLTLFDLWKGFDLHQDNIQKVRARGQHPIFPFVQPRTAFDDFGEITHLEAPVPTPSLFPMKTAKLEDEDDMFDDEGIMRDNNEPTKPVFESLQLALLAKLYFFDFEGRTDLRSIKKILGQVAPRQLVLIQGNAQAKDALASYVHNELSRQISKVYTPLALERIEISSKIPFLVAVMPHQDLSHLHVVQAAQCNLSLFNGLLVSSSYTNTIDETAKMQIEGNNENFEKKEVNSVANPSYELSHIVKLDSVLHATNEENSGTFVGDVQLKNFKAHLDDIGYQTEFQNGILKVNNVVSVQKQLTEIEGRSRLKLDGQMCDDYFKIRDILYSKLTVL